ncbi:MAG: AlkA N-terminal domain-containing protein [Polyangiaceae bacterium]
MLLDPTTCHRALQARDARFDGVFFVGVKTTGVYCRPICPARVPGFARCEFYRRAAEAEKAGFRACFRCRPELAPSAGVVTGSLASVDAVEHLVRAAASRIDAGYLNQASVDDLAAELGVTARHLRRCMESRLGVTPIELAQTRRLLLAKQLLHETELGLTQIALASGFASVRRFNALFQQRFGKPPSALRRARATAPARSDHEFVSLRLDYRPPFDWRTLLGFFAQRCVRGVEHVSDGEYRRSARVGQHFGFLAVRADPKRNALRASVSLSLVPELPTVVARLRALFDLDAHPLTIAEQLGQDPLLAPLVAARPGLRVPGAFDGFEVALRAIVGQQVSVAAATTLCGRLVHEFGVAEASAWDAHIGYTFPSAARLAEASVEQVAALGMPKARAVTIIELSRAVATGALRLVADERPADVIERLQALPGIGPWTAHYVALRALRWPNAFPAADLGVLKALGVSSAKAAEQRAEAWQPWRAYAVLHLWTSTPTKAEP